MTIFEEMTQKIELLETTGNRCIENNRHGIGKTWHGLADKLREKRNKMTLESASMEA